MPTTRDRGPGEVWGQSPDLPGDVDEPTKQASSDVEPRYPDYLMEFPLDIPPEIAARWKRFFDLREDILIDYGHQTARAYYADLQDIFEWAVERDKDVLALEDRDLRQYCALLRRRKYSENTIRRRMVAWRKVQTRMDEEEVNQYDK